MKRPNEKQLERAASPVRGYITHLEYLVSALKNQLSQAQGGPGESKSAAVLVRDGASWGANQNEVPLHGDEVVFTDGDGRRFHVRAQRYGVRVSQYDGWLLWVNGQASNVMQLQARRSGE